MASCSGKTKATTARLVLAADSHYTSSDPLIDATRLNRIKTKKTHKTTLLSPSMAGSHQLMQSKSSTTVLALK